MGVLSNAKDRLVEQAALAYLNGKLLAPYGRATALRLDSAARTISLEAELKGESLPVKIAITDYELKRDGDRYVATIKGIRTSREWLTALALNHLCHVPLRLSEKVGRLLARAL